MLKPDRFSCSQKIQLKRDPPVLLSAMLTDAFHDGDTGISLRYQFDG